MTPSVAPLALPFPSCLHLGLQNEVAAAAQADMGPAFPDWQLGMVVTAVNMPHEMKMLLVNHTKDKHSILQKQTWI